MKVTKKKWGSSKHRPPTEPSYESYTGTVFETREFRKRVAKSRKKAKLARKARKSQ